MRNLIIFLSMILCLFGPTAVFSIVGYKSMQSLSKRPTDSAKTMIALIVKLVIVSAILMAVLGALLKFFA